MPMIACLRIVESEIASYIFSKPYYTQHTMVLNVIDANKKSGV